MRAAAAQIEIQGLDVQRSRGWRYEGQLNQREMLHGRGVYSWASGARYEGEWGNGWRHGHGTMTHADGWNDGGSLAAGRVQSGQWEDGNFLG